jgi:hypothetical protein
MRRQLARSERSAGSRRATSSAFRKSAVRGDFVVLGGAHQRGGGAAARDGHSGKYLNGVPADSRASRDGSLSADQLSEGILANVRALKEIAAARGQSLAQLALGWVLRDQQVTSALIGASSVAQREENLAAAQGLSFTSEELAAIEPAGRGGRHQHLGRLERQLGRELAPARLTARPPGRRAVRCARVAP